MMGIATRTVFMALAALIALPLQADGFDPYSVTHETVLDNGMKVIVREDHRAPVVVSQVWYRIGSSYEYEGITGVSHVLEHMMFKGTDEVPAGRFSEIVASLGGTENAFTGYDYTAYFQSLHKDHLPRVMKLEADRMRNLLLQEEEFAKEVKVVMEERRLRTEDKPNSLTWEQFMATAYVANGYNHPVIGWMRDLENLHIDDLKQWYQRWYAPDNAILVVAGDVEPKRVFALAEQHFGKLKPAAIAPPKDTVEPKQLGPKRIVVRLKAELPALYMGFKAPSLKTAEAKWEPYALDMLSGVLDGGDSARFTRELVREQTIAASASAGYDLGDRKTTLVTLTGIPTDDHTVAELEQAFWQQIERLKTELVDEQELARIKAQVTASKVYGRDSVFYQAMQIGQLETVGLDWREGEAYVERIAAVTPEQIREVARKYLTEDGLTVAVLEPIQEEENGNEK